MKKKVHHSREEMYSSIEDWQDSNLSQAAYCRQQGYSRSIFKYWLRKYRIEKGLSPDSLSNAQSFIPVEVSTPLLSPSSNHSSGSIRISYPNGVQVSCSKDVCSKLLTALVSL